MGQRRGQIPEYVLRARLDELQVELISAHTDYMRRAREMLSLVAQAREAVERQRIEQAAQSAQKQTAAA